MHVLAGHNTSEVVKVGVEPSLDAVAQSIRKVTPSLSGGERAVAL